ncbi:MAG TPA: WS/DGAT domain-containing protein, partial [Burkholderiaceae bacterium]|nr:WS/DGAT domain-containing protein [Burkholderiaceae bacterium]
PQSPLYLAGANMLTYYPVLIAIHSVALNITVQSYNGSLDFGLTACRRAMPDVAHLAQLMRRAHAELLAASPLEPAAEAPPARPVRKRGTRPQARQAATGKPRAPAKSRSARRAAA